jgi:hypothetical protein
MADLRRNAIVSNALGEVNQGVDASQAGNPDETGRPTRQGWDRLFKYFHVAAPGGWSDDVIKYSDRSGLPDWCGIFALWAIKSAGLHVGTWVPSQGISSVRGMTPTSSPQPGDVAFINNAAQHMDLVHSVDGKGNIRTIDGNDSGRVTGPSDFKDRSQFSAFFTAFNERTTPTTPVGRWRVQIGDWTWIYVFRADQTADWRSLDAPNIVQGKGTWSLGGSLQIRWDTGSIESWDLPLDIETQTGLSFSSDPPRRDPISGTKIG